MLQSVCHATVESVSETAYCPDGDHLCPHKVKWFHRMAKTCRCHLSSALNARDAVLWLRLIILLYLVSGTACLPTALVTVNVVYQSRQTAPLGRAHRNRCVGTPRWRHCCRPNWPPPHGGRVGDHFSFCSSVFSDFSTANKECLYK